MLVLMNLTKLASVSLFACALSASTYIGSGLSTMGNTEDASAVFVINNGSITITLANLLANPSSVAQNISDFEFTLSGGATDGTLMSSSGTELNVNSNGSYSLGSSVATGWKLSSSGGSLILDVLGTMEAPAHTIIGPSNNGTYSGGTYAGANNSIAGNDPHNPFLDGAKFVIAIPEVTTDTTVTSVTFSFGTSAGNDLSVKSDPTPEPWSFGFVGVGLLGPVGI